MYTTVHFVYVPDVSTIQRRMLLASLNRVIQFSKAVTVTGLAVVLIDTDVMFCVFVFFYFLLHYTLLCLTQDVREWKNYFHSFY